MRCPYCEKIIVEDDAYGRHVVNHEFKLLYDNKCVSCSNPVIRRAFYMVQKEMR